jgi:hypothetical protein
VYGLATIVFGLSRWFPLSIAAYVLVGVADQVSVVMRSTTIQLSTPDELRGRVSAINMMFIGAIESARRRGVGLPRRADERPVRGRERRRDFPRRGDDHRGDAPRAAAISHRSFLIAPASSCMGAVAFFNARRERCTRPSFAPWHAAAFPGEEGPMTRIPIHLAVLGSPPVLSSSALAQSNDRFTCYAIKDSAPRGRYQVTLSSAAGSQNCIVRTPAKIACVPSTQTAISPATPESGPDGSATGGFLCYLAKCALPSSTINVEDQFGQRVVKFRATRFVCDPGDLTAPTPGSPTTTTTLPGSKRHLSLRGRAMHRFVWRRQALRHRRCRAPRVNAAMCPAATPTRRHAMVPARAPVKRASST